MIIAAINLLYYNKHLTFNNPFLNPIIHHYLVNLKQASKQAKILISISTSTLFINQSIYYLFIIYLFNLSTY
jgi:hypothetical protein